jgi:RHS repeat-associated protein
MVERQTLHVMDDKQRIALVETLTISDKVATASLPQTVIRYQFGNHLGTVCLELDETGAVITYEEYYPYGSTSYQAGTATTETSRKRYRYTGKERDRETGLYYHGARHYIPWLGRWANCDPIGLVADSNLYRYVRGNPIRLSDPSGHEGSEPGQSYAQIDRHGAPPEPANDSTSVSNSRDWLDRTFGKFFGISKSREGVENLPTQFQNDGMNERDFNVEEGIGKGAEGIGRLAQGTNDAVSTVVAGPEAEVDALSARIISKVNSLMHLPKSLLGSLASESKQAKIRVVDAAESFFRRMSFEEAGKTLESQALQASAKDADTWISSSKFYSYTFPQKRGNGRYDVMLEFRASPGTMEFLENSARHVKQELGSINFGLQRPLIEPFNERLEEIRIFSVEPSLTRFAAPNGDIVTNKTVGYSQAVRGNREYQRAVRSVRVSPGGQILQKKPIVTKFR